MIQSEGHDAAGGNAGTLLSRLSSPDWRARQEALEALERWDGPSLARALVDLVRRDPGDLSALSGALDALERIGRLVHGAITGEVITLLDDPDKEMRMVAPLVLGEVGDPAAVPALMRVAQRSEEELNTRFNAIEALGKLGDLSAAQILRQIASNGEPYLRYAAVLALGEVGSKEAVGELLPLLDDDYLAEPAVNSLAQIGDERAAPEIVRWLERRAKSGVCELRVGACALAAISRRADDNDRVQQAFLSAGERLRGCLLAVINEGDPSSAADPLWADLALLAGWMARQNPNDAELRGALIRMLAYAPARPEVEAAVTDEPRLAQAELISLLDDTDPVQAQLAARLLGQARAETAVPELVRALEGGDDSLAAPAAESLGRIGSPEVIDPLLNALGHPSIQVRKSVIGALAVIGDPHHTQRVQGLLGSTDTAIRASALQLLALLDDRAAVEPILMAVSDPEISVRKAAVELLPRLKDPRVLPLLEQALQDSDDTLRSAAVRACTTMPPEQVRGLLVRAAGDENPWVRMHAIRALGLHPSGELLPLFAGSLRDPLAPVRVAAVDALARLPREQAEPYLTAALEDDNEDVRLAARRAMDNPLLPTDGKD